MFCFIVRRKLYDFVEGNLNKSAAERIKGHLGSCQNCSREYEGLKRLLSAASQKKTPELSGDFWAKFDQGLRERLAKEKEIPEEIRLRPQHSRISLKPVFALATVVVLLVAISFYLFGGLPTKERLIALTDERIVNDVEILEELTGESIILDDQDFLLDELILLEELS